MSPADQADQVAAPPRDDPPTRSAFRGWRTLTNALDEGETAATVDSRRNVTSSADVAGATIGFRDGSARMFERSRCDALVGRRHELAALRAAVDRAARGSGGAVVVLGEAGIGKSRLLGEVSGARSRKGWRCWSATRCRVVARSERSPRRWRTGCGTASGNVDHREDGRRDLRLEDEGLRPFLPALHRLVPAWTAFGGPTRRQQPGDVAVRLIC